ncbi:MAG: trk system potassium uptake protein TrkA [Spirochaetes bacterium]|nr:MAG: trk system potassium uptake protein TrkA [Spirochaetota bacterium]
MFVMIVGSGKLGLGLARSMSSRQDDVVIMDTGLNNTRIGDGFDGIIIDGDPMDLNVLDQAGIRNAELFLAVTANDNVNVFCVEAAKTIFNVPKALARIADPERELFFHNIGLETVCPTVSGINQVLDYIAGERFSSLAINFDPSFICIHPLESWVDKPLSKIDIPGKMKIVGVVKNNHIVKLNGHKVFHRDDSVVITQGRGKEDRKWIV